MRTQFFAILGFMLLLSVTTQAHALGMIGGASLTAIPELDPKAGGTALVLLAGVIAVLTARRREIA